MPSEVHYHDQGQANETYHFKILVPSVAAGAIIGKGGETIAQLQKEAGAKVKMSKATDFYPATRERVCLISGSFEGILRIHEFIMEKIKEKPDANARMAIDFDHKQPAEREKQVKILVPNNTAGMIIGKGGSYIKQIKEQSGAYVQTSQKSKDNALAERCITVIGEMENNRIACHMILSKIVEDPLSGSCLNVSYADVTGPVANYNPIGSPFAYTGYVPSGDNRYSSNGSLNSPSPTLTDSFHSAGSTRTRVVSFPGMASSGAVNNSYSSNSSLYSFHSAGSRIVPFPDPGGAMNNSNTSYSSNGNLYSLNSFHNAQGGSTHAGFVPFPGMGGNVAQAIETIKTLLRSQGFSEQELSEISVAISTLANYGLLTLCLTILNSINGGLGMPNSAATSCPVPPGGMTNQGMYTTGAPGMEAACNYVATSGPMGAGSSMVGPIVSLGNGMSELCLEPSFASPTSSRSSDHYIAHSEAAESFQRSSPALASPSAAALPVNNNSFGLGNGLSSGSRSLRKSSDRQIGDSTKIEIEVGENIVGAILGPGGKSLVEIQRFTGANIQISKKGIFAPGTCNRIVTITGLSNSVNTAQYLIERQIADEKANRAQQNAMGVLH